jgi:tetratricopeptide (TPR) repeat protein
MNNSIIIVSKLLVHLGAFLLLSLSIFSSVAAQVAPSKPMPIRVVPRMVVPEARLPIRLQKVEVRAEVLGLAAHTRIEMVFFNPNERALEGELQFPLLDGQSVSGFALDINGELRPAVPVDKAKGQQVFEEVSRVRIDPALLEKTQGNNYKLRVYPLPAHGTRRVVLEIDEMLSNQTRKGISNATYRLPLQFAGVVEQLDVIVHNAATPSRYSAMAVRARLGVERIKVAYAYLSASDNESHSGSLVSFSRKNYAGKEVLSIDYPNTETSLMTSETFADQTYFYAEVSPPTNKPAPRAAPKKLGVVWDASGSGGTRDHVREFALLDAYFKVLGSVNVELVIARDRAEVSQYFTIVNGDWNALRDVLENMAYDGATDLTALSPPKTADLNLLFSDGLSNYGSGVFVAGDVPLYTVNAAASADLPRLRAAAEQTGGRLLNLLSVTHAEALNELTHQTTHLFSMHSNGAKELVSASVYPEGNRLKIAGILSDSQAVIDLDWLTSQGQHLSQQVKIQVTTKPVTSLAASRWAVFKLAQLEADYTSNRAAIRRLGNKFGMVTRETSLIVLDRVQDYVRYEIVPPESLRGEYERLLAQKVQKQSEDRNHHLEEVVAKFAQKTAWWEKTFPKGDVPEPPKDARETRESARRPLMAMALAPPPEPVAIAREHSARQTLVANSSSARQSVVTNFSPAMHSDAPVAASIQLKKWEPDATYAKRLRAVPTEQMYRIYLDELPSYDKSTAFFLDAADIFMERGQAELGLRILSNLAEMNLENRQILRILAYRLLQAKQTKLALPILQQVLVLSPNEPQSWRDLGLAYAEDAQYQLAVDNLWEVVSRSWDRRFPDIELIALNELNAIVARTPQEIKIDTNRMDVRLLRNLSLDVRAVLSWDADNTDIDLWVTDPNGEKVYYGNHLGYQGGSMSSDFTQGYGPEEFSLRKAKPGKYKVQAHFYGNRQQIVSGATTVMLRLNTGFGTAQQKDENIIMRLGGQGEDVEVGTFEVKGH